jgi:murein DD-endopeptidase MepM/ murein hydrolase activator NlpD
VRLTYSFMQRLIIALVLLIVIAGCQSAPDDLIAGASLSPTSTATPEAPATPTFAPTATAPSTATATATATSTPTPTPTPTPTALPLAVSGDARAVGFTTPPAEGSACGVVDWLDFPLDPPDADSVISGGRDFGAYRGRYQQYHAGEDWWRSRGRSNFGTPVYSIGHGRVTYAAPLGWGRDQGVLIVRHTFSDGRTFLSFYGHLDPPSIVLRVGECVARGDKVGEIGDPRTPPHLHFEIRTHMANEPGPGYWPEDPILAGWLPPSQTIWESRIAASPGVQWTRPVAAGGTRGLGILDGTTYAVIEDEQIIGIQIADGGQSWRIPSENRINAGLADDAYPLIYTANSPGQIDAYQLPGSQEGNTNESISDPLWSLDLEGFGFPTLMPLPGGGIVLARGDQLIAISPEGEILWQVDSIHRPFDWLLTDDALIFSTIGRERSLWTVGESGPLSWEIEIGGHLAGRGDQLWLYGVEGIYRLDPSALSARLLYELPQGLISHGDIIALPGGGVLVAHRDRADRRLIALDSDGAVRWQRSYAGLVEGDLSLLLIDDQLFVVAEQEANGIGELSIYALDLEEMALTHIFSGGTRSSVSDFTQALAAGEDQILINIGGGSMVLLDPQEALEAVLSTLPSR